MRNLQGLLIISVILLTVSQTVNAAFYTFSQSGWAMSEIKGSFYVDKTSGVVTQDDIKNFSINLAYETERNKIIEFNLDTNNLTIKYGGSWVVNTLGYYQENFETYTGGLWGGSFDSLRCFGEEREGCYPGDNFDQTEAPLIVAQTPTPDALGLFALGISYLLAFNHRSKSEFTSD
jgi:hypothetical protein